MTGLVILLVLAALYFLPVIIAVNRGYPNAVPIALVNVLLGWTFLGWAIALIWSASAFQTVIVAGPDGPQQAVVISNNSSAGAAIGIVVVAMAGLWLLSSAAYWYYEYKMKPLQAGNTTAFEDTSDEALKAAHDFIIASGNRCDKVNGVSNGIASCNNGSEDDVRYRMDTRNGTTTRLN